MADVIRNIQGIAKRFRDMFDGSHAEVMYIGGVGGLVQPLPVVGPVETYVAGHERLTLAAATAPLTVPAGATKALIVAEGGDVHYAPAGAASAVSPGYIPAGSAVKVPPPAAVYGAVGAFANVVYLA